jgi:hypothetical protein
MRWTIRLTPLTATLAATVLLCAVYVLWTPVSPDLAAQLARADVVRRTGDLFWWTGWFGGLTLPTYSVVAPQLMAWLGVSLTGALATVGGCCGAAVLLRDAPRPWAGALAFSLFGLADLVAGRITFVVGLTFAIWALVAVRARRRLASPVLALLTFFGSPLAALFLGVVLLAVFVSDRTRRWQAGTDAGVLLLSGAVLAVLFPGAGVMPVGYVGMIWPCIGLLAVAVTCRQPVVRTAALFALAAYPVLLVYPGAIGSNMARLAWVAAVPVVVGCATLKRVQLVIVALGLTVWPAITVGAEVHWFPVRSAAAAYYQPLVDHLQSARAAAGPRSVGERLELLDTANHSGAYYLAQSVPLARGWDRQVDKAANRIFYYDGELTRQSYDAWLHQLAVGWVAIPATQLDYAHATEAALIDAGVPALRLVWSSPDWRLYRVRNATPLASGARVTAVGSSSVTLRTTAPSKVTLRMQWSPYLRVIDARTGRAIAACVSERGRSAQIYLPGAGDFTVVGRFDPLARFRSPDDDCAADLQHTH